MFTGKTQQNQALAPLFWMPIQKAYESQEILDDDGQPARIIEGWASVDDGEPDLQGDKVSIDGIDDSLFLRDKLIKGKRCKMGAINWDHSNEPEHHLGRPLAAHKSPGFYHIKARLDKGGKSDAIWEKCQKNRPHEHGFGFSLQGIARARDPNDPSRITKCLIHKISITPQDINTKTWIDAVKIHKGLDFESLEIVADGLASHKEDEMSRKAQEALVLGASKVIGRQKEDEAVGFLRKGLSWLGLSPNDAGRLAKETRDAVLQKAVDGDADDKDKGKDKDEEEAMAKGAGCDHKGDGAYCTKCGTKMSKSFNLAEHVEADQEASEVMDSTPWLKRLVKSLSAGFDSLQEQIGTIGEPMAKGLAAGLAQAEESRDLATKTLAALDKISQENETLKKSIVDLQAFLGTAGKQPASGSEAVRKSVDGTAVEDKTKTTTEQMKSSEILPSGLVRYRAVDRAVTVALQANLQKSVADGTIPVDEATLYMLDLQNRGGFDAKQYPGVDLLKPVSN